MSQAAPWLCPTCRAAVGRVVDGMLLLTGRRVAIDAAGLAMVVCARGAVRPWKPGRRGDLNLAGGEHHVNWQADS